MKSMQKEIIIIIILKQKCPHINMDGLGDHYIKVKEIEKLKYTDIQTEVDRMCDVQYTIISVIIEELWS